MTYKFNHCLLFVLFACVVANAQGLKVNMSIHNVYGILNTHLALNSQRDSLKTTARLDPYKNYRTELISHEVFHDKYYFFRGEASTRTSYGINSKDMGIILMPEHEVVIHKSEGVLTFTPYKDFFTNGGFTKTGEKKSIHGIPVEKYRLSPSFLNIDIWVGSQQKSNRITDFLNELKLLEAIPKDKKVIAFVSDTREYDVHFLTYRKQRKGWLAKEFGELLKISPTTQKAMLDCKKTYKLTNTPLGEVKNIPKKIKFSHKSAYKTFTTFFYENEKENDTYTLYWNDKSAACLQTNDIDNTFEQKFLFLQNEKITLYGSLKDQTFLATNAKIQLGKKCTKFGAPTLLKKYVENGRELSTYMISDTWAGNICTIVMDEKSVHDTSFLFHEYNLPKGEVLKIDTFKQSYNKTIEITTVKESKKIKIDVKK